MTLKLDVGTASTLYRSRNWTEPGPSSDSGDINSSLDWRYSGDICDLSINPKLSGPTTDNKTKQKIIPFNTKKSDENR